MSKVDALRRSASQFLLPTVIFCCFSILYFFTTNQIFSFDAVTNAIACESIEIVRWFHPNHLFYPFFGVLYYKLERALGYTGLAIYSLARLNSLLAASALALFYSTIKTETNGKTALLAALFMGVIYAVWHYAVDGRAIGASIFFSVLVISALLKTASKNKTSKLDILRLSIFSSLYCLLHGIAVFHTLAIAFFLFRCEKNTEKKYTAPLLYLAGVFIFIFVPYVSIFFGVIHRVVPENFLRWSLGYAGYEGPAQIAQSGFWVRTFFDAVRGLWFGWASAFLPLRPLSVGFVSSVIALVFVGLTLGFAAKFKTGPDRKKYLVQTLILWGILTTLFLAVWSPGQEGFRLIVIIPWLAALLISSFPSKSVNWFLGVGAAAAFALNLTTAIYPAAFIQNNKGLQALIEIRSNLNAQDLFLSLRGEAAPGMEVLMPYFFPEMRGGTIQGRLFAFREKSLGPLLERLKTIRKEGHQIYMSDDVFDVAQGHAVERKLGLREGEIQDFLKSVKQEGQFGLSNGHHVFRVELSGGEVAYLAASSVDSPWLCSLMRRSLG